MAKRSSSIAAMSAALALSSLISSPARAESTPPTGATTIAPDSDPSKPGNTLSDKLNASNGVIHPREVDPAIQRPAPKTGTDGVIKPPGTPGGAPAPEAK